MNKFTLSVVAAILLVAGIAYGQVALPMQSVQADRVVVKIDAGRWKNVSIQADSAAFEKDGMRLTGNVHITVSGHVMSANTALLGSELLTLDGDAKVDSSAGR
jgi:hypothetical protein